MTSKKKRRESEKRALENEEIMAWKVVSLLLLFLATSV